MVQIVLFLLHSSFFLQLIWCMNYEVWPKGHGGHYSSNKNLSSVFISTFDTLLRKTFFLMLFFKNFAIPYGIFLINVNIWCAGLYMNTWLKLWCNDKVQTSTAKDDKNISIAYYSSKINKKLKMNPLWQTPWNSNKKKKQRKK